jgi:hypothetical protein
MIDFWATWGLHPGRSKTLKNITVQAAHEKATFDRAVLIQLFSRELLSSPLFVFCEMLRGLCAISISFGHPNVRVRNGKCECAR